MKPTEIGTYYVPEGESRTVTFPKLREGNDSASILLAMDRGTLLAPCYVEEADSDGLLMLKQYNADRLAVKLEMLAEYQDWAGEPVRIHRTETGGFEVETTTVDELEEAM